MENLKQDSNVVVHEKPKKAKKILRIDKIIIWTLFVVFMIYALSLIYPLIWGLISSFKNRLEYRREPFGLPEKWLFSNYKEAVQRISDGGFTYLEMFWNSLWFTVGSCAISVFFTTAYAYVLNKYQFRGRNFLYNLCLFMIAVPIGASFVSTYRLYFNLGLANSYAILCLARVLSELLYGTLFNLKDPMASGWGKGHLKDSLKKKKKTFQFQVK